MGSSHRSTSSANASLGNRGRRPPYACDAERVRAADRPPAHARPPWRRCPRESATTQAYGAARFHREWTLHSTDRLLHIQTCAVASPVRDMSQVKTVYGSLTTAIVVLLSLEIPAMVLLPGARRRLPNSGAPTTGAFAARRSRCGRIWRGWPGTRNAPPPRSSPEAPGLLRAPLRSATPARRSRRGRGVGCAGRRSIPLRWSG